MNVVKDLIRYNQPSEQVWTKFNYKINKKKKKHLKIMIGSQLLSLEKKKGWSKMG